MARSRLKIAVICFVLAIVWACGCGFAGTFRYKHVCVDGVSLDGLTVSAAEKLLRARYERELSVKKLVVTAGGREYSFSYPEIGYHSDLSAVLRAAKGGKGEYTVSRRYYLRQAERVLGGICQSCAVRAEAARAIFTADFDNPFEFEEGRGATYVDFDRLRADVDEALNNGTGRVVARMVRTTIKQNVETLRRERVKLSSFTTCFSAGNAPRVHNIALAARKINGCILAPGEEFSFNARVGVRSAENGFLSAPIILEGEFVEGVGGGVCQASTTLYNAALLAGMDITEQHPHSLRVGYVEPSFDAMVSGRTCDLRFVNPSDTPVYIVCRATSEKISFAFYGMESDIRYVRKSVVKREILPPEQEVIEGEEDCVIRAEKAGLESEGYLLVYRKGIRISARKLRRDKYAAVRGIVQKKEKSVANSEEV